MTTELQLEIPEREKSVIPEQAKEEQNRSLSFAIEFTEKIFRNLGLFSKESQLTIEDFAQECLSNDR